MHIIKKLVIILTSIIAAWYILPHIIGSVMLLMLMGIIPGTGMRIPSWVMLTLYVLIALSILIASIGKSSHPSPMRRQLPGRRYSEI